MLGRQHHVGRAEQRVRTGREHPEIAVHAVEREVHLGADRAADPVLLHLPGAGRPVHPLEVLEQAVGVGGDLEHPLAHRPAHHVEAADLALAVDDLLVGQHRAQGRAPVDRHVRHVGQAAFEELEEDPLRPAVVAGVGGVDLTRPVVREPGALHLPPEGGDVLGGGDRRMDAGLDRVLLGGQAEGVPAHRVQDVEAAHALVTRDDVAGRVALEVADVKSRPGRVWEHVEAVELGLARDLDRPEGAVLLPVGLPAGLDLGERVTAHGLERAHGGGRDRLGARRIARTGRGRHLGRSELGRSEVRPLPPAGIAPARPAVRERGSPARGSRPRRGSPAPRRRARRPVPPSTPPRRDRGRRGSAAGPRA